MRWLTMISAVALALASGVFPAVGQQLSAEDMVRTLPKSALKSLERDPAQFRVVTLSRLYQLNPDGVVTEAHILAHAQTFRARQRAQRLSQVLSHDIDGNGAISAEEFDLTLAQLPPQQRAQAVVFRVEADRDRDGIVAFAEAVARIEVDLDQQSRSSSSEWSVMALDIDRDGQVTATEALQAIEEIHALVSGEAETRRKAFDRSEPGRCLPPRPSKNAIVVAISGYGGDALSSVAMAGQDFVTTATTIHVEKGERPVWIFATAYEPIVWNVVGEVGRIERFVVQPNLDILGPGAGVAGLPGEKVEFLPANACFEYLTSAGGGKGVLARATLAEAAGKPVDALIAAQALSEFAVPSGKKMRKPNSMIIDMMTPPGDEMRGPKDYGPSAGPEKKTRASRMMDFRMAEWLLSETKPGGVLEFDPKDVVAPGSVESFEIQPQFAGVLQLMEDGSLWRTSDGYFVIKKPIKRLPPGLSVGHRVTFILGAGVPLPDGGPWDVQVISEETGKCLSGPSVCR